MRHRAAFHTIAAAIAIFGVVAVGSAGFTRAASSSSSGELTVHAGDTLWAIAGAHGITVDQLAAANHMSPSDLLLIGRQLVIPSTTGSGSGGSSGSGAGADFCATTSFVAGPYGQIPSFLAASPGRLALRPLFVRWADAYGVAPALVEAVAWQESGWQEGVVSGDGAIGIGQILPATASFVDNYLIGVNLNPNVASDNIQIESLYLAYLIRQVGNNPCEVAAAYYEGPQAVASYGVFQESQQYIRDVLALEPEFS